MTEPSLLLWILTLVLRRLWRLALLLPLVNSAALAQGLSPESAVQQMRDLFAWIQTAESRSVHTDYAAQRTAFTGAWIRKCWFG